MRLNRDDIGPAMLLVMLFAMAIWLGWGCTPVDDDDAPADDDTGENGDDDDGADDDDNDADDAALEGMVLIPAGEFEMGDHTGWGGEDPNHPSDEQPVHWVSLDEFYMGRHEVTTAQWAEFLNATLEEGAIEVAGGLVLATAGGEIYADTEQSEASIRIGWDGSQFSVLGGREDHPASGVRWFGAIAYCNWKSREHGYAEAYELTDGGVDLGATAFRLPTEAEWEYAARGGQHDPYQPFPWGDDTNGDGSYANWQSSGDPWEGQGLPETTPVGFYDGSLRDRADYDWPGNPETYQTSDGSNGYGLHDMAGNVWEFVNDWYGREYYQSCADASSESEPFANPPGPSSGDPMPDGQPYRNMRGGNWYNGAEYYGHARVANRDPSYFRGPEDPDHPWYHVGFRVILARP